MLTVPTSTTNGWSAKYKGGVYRPCTRVTVQKMSMILLNYDLSGMDSTSLEGSGKFASMPFGQASIPVELPNIQKVSWTRNLSQFVANGTVMLTNTVGLGVGVLNDAGEFDKPGTWSFQRGDSTESTSRWGFEPNAKNGLLVPDRIIRIYQGYGSDMSHSPETDPNMTLTFTGLIDTITLNTDKTLNIAFRDMGRALMDTTCWPDVVPWSQYPVRFDTRKQIIGPDEVVENIAGTWLRPTYHTDSNKSYVGAGIRDGSRAYVDSDGGINGHIGKHAFDSSSGSYWLSVGNRKNWPSAYEYVEGSFPTGSVGRVKVSAYAGPYTVYISLKQGSTWLGHHKIPYKSQEVDTHADIKFVTKVRIGKGETLSIKLPQVYTGVSTIRVTFSDLWDSEIGKYEYRAGCKDIQVFDSNFETTIHNPLIWVGNIKDYTDVIRWFAAWGGFFWPEDSSGFSYITQSDGTVVDYTHADTDGGYIPHGRIWGDLQATGTSPITTLTQEQFDKQPLSACMDQIKQLIGFNLFVDETGGIIWRLPNIYQKGNYISGENGGPNSGRTSDYVTIDENNTLLGLSTVVSSANVRERVFVGNVTGKFGAISEGYNPYPSGLRRYGGYTSVYFESQDEVKVMADLIALQQFMTFRQSTITIAANPAIQIDDQVKIYEKITSDTYFHYVNGIQSDYDAGTGKWTYTLNTSWLGTDPNTQDWVVDKGLLDPLTQNYLEGLGGGLG